MLNNQQKSFSLLNELLGSTLSTNEQILNQVEAM